jgi:hypothetical protein
MASFQSGIIYPQAHPQTLLSRTSQRKIAQIRSRFAMVGFGNPAPIFNISTPV